MDLRVRRAVAEIQAMTSPQTGWATNDSELAAARAIYSAGAVTDAIARYEAIVQVDPHCSEGLRWLAFLRMRAGDRTSARNYVDRALAIDETDAAAHRLSGALFEGESRPADAFSAYVRACGSKPPTAAIAAALARMALALERPAQAARIAAAALARGNAGDVDLLRLLGIARVLQRQYAGAIDALEPVVAAERNADLLAHLGAAYLGAGRIEAAAAALEEALAIASDHPPAALNLGIARLAQARYDDAIAAFEAAIAGGCEEAHRNLGRLLLLLGRDEARAWAHFGWDDATRRALPVYRALPMWDGRPAPDARLAVWHEQGVGDTILVARFLRAARDRVGSLHVACPRGTGELLRSVDGVDALIDLRGPTSFDEFDCWLPTTRLPAVMEARLNALPRTPYIVADPVRIARFAPALHVAADASATWRVGLVWAGNPAHSRDADRSCPLAAFAPLGALPRMTWYALQQGAARADVPPAGLTLVPINAAVNDYADTAAIVAQLDLVITVDTSVANLAGAMGRPAWVLVAHTPDWRWRIDGIHSPWYPTVRIFRQPTPGDWKSVIDTIAQELRIRARSGWA